MHNVENSPGKKYKNIKIQTEDAKIFAAFFACLLAFMPPLEQNLLARLKINDHEKRDGRKVNKYKNT